MILNCANSKFVSKSCLKDLETLERPCGHFLTTVSLDCCHWNGPPLVVAATVRFSRNNIGLESIIHSRSRALPCRSIPPTPVARIVLWALRTLSWPAQRQLYRKLTTPTRQWHVRVKLHPMATTESDLQVWQVLQHSSREPPQLATRMQLPTRAITRSVTFLEREFHSECRQC